MHNIKNKLMDELYEMEQKLKNNPGTKVSEADLQKIHMLTDTVKNIDKIEMLEDGGGYSEERGMRNRGGYSGDGEWEARGGYGGRSNRSSYGEGGFAGGGAGGSSYARGQRRDSMGRYSRDGGMMHRLEELMREAETEKEREAIRACMSKIGDD